ncbi:MAG: L-aspartate oxidase [Anaerovoracaceae bacterium]
MNKVDYIIVGSGIAGIFCALNLPTDKKVLIITKDAIENCDSYLAQGGICVKRNENDFFSFFEDTMKAGHFENNKESVKIMIENSREVIDDLINLGVEFTKRNNELDYTKEGAHSIPRILYHADITGKEIMTKLIKKAMLQENITIMEFTEVIDLISSNNKAAGVVCLNKTGDIIQIIANYVVLATGGVGGLYPHSTNFPHLTGDGLAIAIKNNVVLENVDYVQIHPTSLYQNKSGKSFLISESVRGEGGILLNKAYERFTDELMPRDVVSKAILKQMEIDGTDHVWLSFENIDSQTILEHFPNIYKECLEAGFDITKEPIPVVPAQHYYMGGIKVDSNSKTSMDNLYAIGETSCNGVHGSNRLASNSLLEGLVFAKIASIHMENNYEDNNITTIPYITGTGATKDKTITDYVDNIVKGNIKYEYK